MNVIKTIDLWTEQHDNHYECFNGAFIDGFENEKLPFNEYKIVKNCNCIISIENKDVNINNKHNAIVFYKDSIPVRLMVINKNTDIDKCISIALSQHFNDSTLNDYYDKNNIKSKLIDMNEESIFKDTDNTKSETDIGFCDRLNLLYCMLKGSYTESDTSYGNFQSDRYEFIPDIFIKYELTTDTEKFEIEHKCAFINTIKTRLIPIQENSSLTKQS